MRNSYTNPFSPAAISTIICDVADKVRLILDCVSSRKHMVHTIALMEAFDSELVARAQTCGIEILSFKDLVVRPHIQSPPTFPNPRLVTQHLY